MSRRWSASLVGMALVLMSTHVLAQTPAQPTPPPEDPPAEAAPPGSTPPDASPPAPTVTPPNPEATPAPAPDAAAPVHYPVMGKAREIQLSPIAAIRFGAQAQVWADASQDSNREADGSAGDYQYNMFVRRPRVFAGIQVGQNITAFMLLEGPNLGRATGNAANPKNFDSLAFLEAWADVKLHDAFIIAGGLMLVPLTRNGLQGTTTYFSLDVGNTSAVAFAALQQSLLRDTGFQVKGMLADDHFEYRIGVHAGIREAPSMMPPELGAKNAPLFAAFAQYNFLDTEKGYVFNGTYYGKKKVLGVAAGFNYQKGTDVDPYQAVSGAVFAAIPLNGDPKNGGDEVGGIAQYVRYNGNETAPGVPLQNDFLAELAYYNKASKLSVFGKFETILLSSEALKPLNRRFYGGGFKYHLAENLCNFTFAYNRQEFQDAPTSGMGAKNATNQFTVAMQVFYY